MPGRQATITLPGGVEGDLERFEAVERLSELFVITAQVRCPRPVDFSAQLGQPVQVSVSNDGEHGRVFHGNLFEAEFLEDLRPTSADTVLGTGVVYRLTLRPWTYWLTRNLDYIIFQNLAALDIIQKVFQSRGFDDFDATSVTRGKAPRNYCVQYRESDFDFVSRLMEEEGIYYFFRHEDGKHTLTLCDSPAGHPGAVYDGLQYFNVKGGARSGQDYVWRWAQKVGSSGEKQVTLRNFDFRLPTAQPQATASSGETASAVRSEVYDYPAHFGAVSDNADGSDGSAKDGPDGSVLAAVVMKARQRQDRLFQGEGDALALACGEKFQLSGNTIDAFDGEFMITGLRHEIVGEIFRSGAAGGAPEPVVWIEAVPADTVWRAPLRTPKPVARGPETAIVTGPSGEEIYTDQYGRVQVYFPWDRVGSANSSKTSCWIRVASSLAGNNFGELYLPRVGQEVIVDFLDGDPDRPLVTGRVYNGAQKTSVGALPDNRTRSGIRTQTAYGKSTSDYDGAVSPPTDEPGFNEILFEDKSGQELLSIRAQRDMKEHVYRDETRYTHRDQTEEIGRNRTTTIHTGNDTYKLEQGDESHTVSLGKRTTQVQQDESLKVVQGNMSTTVSQGDQTTTVSMGNQTTTVSMGDISVKASLGKIEMEAMQQIVLKVGQSTVTIDQMGVTVKGMMITSEAQVQIQTKGVIAQHTADAMMEVKGGIVMIN